MTEPQRPSRKRARLFAGTSGFSYPEWRGAFYPKDLHQDQMLQHYSRVFPTVEINNTFYRYPLTAHVEQWRKATPKEFRFSIKAHRLITHIRRLRDVEETVRVQLDRIEPLGDRRGPMLFQLPPSLRADVTLLRDFLYALPPMLRAIEFRHESWYTEEIYAVLAEHRTALVIMESDEDEPVMQFVGPFLYLRLHRYRYAPSRLHAWSRTARDALAAGKDVYAYFTHEEDTPGPKYAEALRALVEEQAS